MAEALPLGEGIHAHANDPAGAGPCLVLELGPHAAGEDELSRGAVAVNGALQGPEYFGDLLPLVEEERPCGPPECGIRVGSVRPGHSRFVEARDLRGVALSGRGLPCGPTVR